MTGEGRDSKPTLRGEILTNASLLSYVELIICTTVGPHCQAHNNILLLFLRYLVHGVLLSVVC